MDATGEWMLALAGGGWVGSAYAASAANIWNPVGWILGGVAVVGTIAVVGVGVYKYSKAKTTSSTKTKVLADVKATTQSGKPYQLAYISNYGALMKLGNKDALAALGITGATNSISQRFYYDIEKSSSAQRQLEHLASGNWGIYADSQAAAKALAVVFGFTGKPEVHGSGMYGHYHGGYISSKTGKYEHVFHIWYGGVLSY